jgi:hypothetical protein
MGAVILECEIFPGLLMKPLEEFESEDFGNGELSDKAFELVSDGEKREIALLVRSAEWNEALKARDTSNTFDSWRSLFD